MSEVPQQSQKVILIVCEGNNANLFSIAAESYPQGKEPKVGDLIPLRARRTYKGVTTAEASEKKGGPLDITFLNGLYKVTAVRSGKGYDLHPEARGSVIFTLNEDVEGFGITLARDSAPLLDTMTPIIARIEVGVC